MSDRYQDFASSSLGKVLVKNLGLPNPVKLDRYVAGSPLVDGVVAIGGSGRLAGDLPKLLDTLGIETVTTPDPATRYRGLVLDATDLADPGALVALRDFFGPLMRSLRTCARLVVLGTPPELTSGEERIAQRALEGFTRSLGKEVGRGGTSQLVYVAPGAEGAVGSTLGFLLSPKSAYVSGQVIRVGTHAKEPAETPGWEQPLAGKVALVTGAARGIGEQIARVLARDGATVIGVDVPQAADDLIRLTRELEGDYLTLDITAKDAPKRIAQHLTQTHGGVDVVVHNAGITRDKRLANMDQDRWNAVLAVNLVAPQRITDELLAQNLIRDNGRIVGVASIAGIAGNVGQTNYAASKAGVIGLVEALKDELGNGVTVNAVAPGFIETKMTAAVPFATREVGRRMNSLSQGGQPVDVAETIAWMADPASTAVNGNVVRVCGQMMLGA
ncbi:MAG TPA: 3-oxoacyl-ACP reductase [Nocardioides sp.]|jgi:3-oxoacyl-[acyl-carrier protein] reductase|nr:3-oxoacyl-ACP reductase [Nocardioides sp.]